jgi:hypothetical protein
LEWLESMEFSRRQASVQIRQEQSDLRREASVVNMTEGDREQIQAMLSPASILDESEGKLQVWCSEQVEHAAQVFLANVSETVHTAVTSMSLASDMALGIGDACLKPNEASTVIWKSLVAHSRDGTGLFDHAQGGSIVHQYTSITYTPPAQTYNTVNYNTHEVWWARFVPQDWEKVLPEGWNRRGLSGSNNGSWAGLLKHTLGWNRGTGVAPPETVLHPNILPGSCWPMQGTSGSITIRLPHPVHISAVTIEHAPRALLDQLDGSSFTSAPKNIKVFGLPACPEPECDGLGFDKMKSVLIAQFQFVLEAGGVQTFSVTESESKGDRHVEGSCEPQATTCTAPELAAKNMEVKPTIAPYSPFAGVTFEIQDNYGNEAFTCLYRLRVHGETDNLAR